jgi:hypothetical protein
MLVQSFGLCGDVSCNTRHDMHIEQKLIFSGLYIRENR